MTHYLLDTNIILRFADANSAEHVIISDAIFRILEQGDRCFITAQVVIEFWVVATRPVAVNGLGWDVEKTERAVQMLISQFEWLEEVPDIFTHWLNLVTTNKISGKRTHDLRIEAVMLAHDVSHILTLNPKDFVAVEGITIVHPHSIKID
jgi:predicted nucleic acid-binding protein